MRPQRVVSFVALAFHTLACSTLPSAPLQWFHFILLGCSTVASFTTAVVAADEEANEETINPGVISEDELYICDRSFWCLGNAVALRVYRCKADDPLGGFGSKDIVPRRINISIYWGEVNSTIYPAPNDGNFYDFFYVNFETGQGEYSDPQAQRILDSDKVNSTLLAASAMAASSSDMTYYLHNGDFVELYHVYNQPGAYRPLYAYDVNDGRFLSYPCGFTNYECTAAMALANQTANETATTNATVNSDDQEVDDAVECFLCDAKPFYIGVDGTCSDRPIVPSIPADIVPSSTNHKHHAVVGGNGTSATAVVGALHNMGVLDVLYRFLGSHVLVTFEVHSIHCLNKSLYILHVISTNCI